MNTKQKTAVIIPFVLIPVMILVFLVLARVMGPDAGWYLGLCIYWIFWCGALALWLTGREGLKEIIRPQKPDLKVVLLVTVPLGMAFAWKALTGMSYEKPDLAALALLISTCFGNGFFEEVFWRGTYMRLFPDRDFFRIIWSSVFFALWHYAPGSVHGSGDVLPLITGSFFFGIYLSYLAKRTNTISWSIICHILGGIIMVL